MAENPLVSIIVPVLNEEHIIVDRLSALQALREVNVELIVVDGGSVDNTALLSQTLADKVLHSEKGRALQMNAGAAVAKGVYCVFLHIDTQLPANFLMCANNWQRQHIQWGFFALKLSGSNGLLRLIEKGINWRSALSGIGTGDQVIFCSQSLFHQVGGYQEIPLMEDVALCKQLKKHVVPLTEKNTVITSSRRWEENGILHTVLLMWRLRLAYFLGVSPEKLVKRYYGS